MKLKKDLPFLSYFIMIGIGFMLFEISQMQRLTVFLGQPTYSLTVVLFTILISAGVGSYFSGNHENRSRDAFRLGALVFILFITGLLSQWVLSYMAASGMPARILVSVLLLAPAGLLLGMAFPMGMRRAFAVRPDLTPWLWGVNGAASVFASVLAIVIALEFGISFAYWCGIGVYGLAFAAYYLTDKT